MSDNFELIAFDHKMVKISEPSRKIKFKASSYENSKNKYSAFERNAEPEVEEVVNTSKMDLLMEQIDFINDINEFKIEGKKAIKLNPSMIENTKKVAMKVNSMIQETTIEPEVEEVAVEENVEEVVAKNVFDRPRKNREELENEKAESEAVARLVVEDNVDTVTDQEVEDYLNGKEIKRISRNGSSKAKTERYIAEAIENIVSPIEPLKITAIEIEPIRINEQPMVGLNDDIFNPQPVKKTKLRPVKPLSVAKVSREMPLIAEERNEFENAAEVGEEVRVIEEPIESDGFESIISDVKWLQEQQAAKVEALAKAEEAKAQQDEIFEQTKKEFLAYRDSLKASLDEQAAKEEEIKKTADALRAEIESMMQAMGKEAEA